MKDYKPEYVADKLHEERMLKAFNDKHNPNSKEVKHWIAFTQTAGILIAVVMAVAVVILLEAFKAPSWVYTCVIFACLIAILFMWAKLFDKRTK